MRKKGNEKDETFFSISKKRGGKRGAAKHPHRGRRGKSSSTYFLKKKRGGLKVSSIIKGDLPRKEKTRGKIERRQKQNNLGRRERDSIPTRTKKKKNPSPFPPPKKKKKGEKKKFPIGETFLFFERERFSFLVWGGIDYLPRKFGSLFFA